MSDNRLILTVSIDQSPQVVGNLNKEIQELSKKLEALKLKIEIDPNVLRTLTDFSKNINQVTQATQVQNTSIKNTTDAINKETQAINAATEAQKKYNIEKQKTVTAADGSYKTTSTISGTKFNNTTTSQTEYASGDIVDHPTIQKIDYAGLEKAQISEYNKMLDEAYKMNADFDKNAEALDKAHYQAIVEDQKRADQQKRAIDKDYVQWWQSTLKEMETIDKAHYMALQEDQKRNDAQLKAQQLAQQKQQEAQLKPGSVVSGLSSIGGDMSMLKFAGQLALLAGVNEAIHGTIESVKMLEDGMAGLGQVFEESTKSQEDLNKVTNDFLTIATKYGVSSQEMLEVAKLVGRQYKDEAEALAISNNVALLSVVDNVKVQDGMKALEATMNSFGMTVRNANDAQAYSSKIVDSWSELAHKAAISANDLAKGTETAGAAAHEAGVSFDQLQALITAGVRATGKSGQEIGNTLKSLFSTIRDTQSEKALDSIGIKLKEVGADGKQVYRDMFDVLLDVSRVMETTDENQQKMLTTISGGRFQWSKVSATLGDYNHILDAYAISLNSAGAANDLASIQMNTLSRDVQRLKDVFTEMVASMDDNGLGQALKSIVEGLTNLLQGLEQLPKGATETVLAIGGLVVGLRTLTGLMQTFQPLATLMIGAYARMTAGATATAVAEGEAAIATGGLTAAFTALDIVSGGIVIAIGLVVTAVTAWAISAGKATQAAKDHAAAVQQQIGIEKEGLDIANQKSKFLDTAIQQETSLRKALDDTTLSTQNRNKILGELVSLYQAVGKVTGDTALQQVNASNVMNASLQGQREAIAKLVQAKKTAYENEVTIENQQIQDDMAVTKQKIQDTSDRISNLQLETKAEWTSLSFWDKIKVAALNTIGYIHKGLGLGDEDKFFGEAQDVETNKHDKDLSDAQAELAKLNDSLAKNEYKLASNNLDLANIDTSGESETGNVVPEVKGKIKTGSSPSEYSETEKYTGTDPYTRQQRDFEGQLKDSESAMQSYNETSKEYRKELQNQIDIHKAQEDAASKEADRLRGENEKIKQKIGTFGSWDSLSKTQKDNLNKLYQQLDQNENKIAELSKSWWDYQLAASQAQKKVTESVDKESKNQVDAATKALTATVTPYEDKVKSLKTAMDSLKTDPAGKVKDQNDIIAVYQQEQQQILSNIKALQDLSSTLDANSDAWSKVQDEIKKYQDQSAQIDSDAYAIKQKIAQDTVDLMKKAYEAEKQAQLDALDSEQKAFDDATQAKIDDLDKLRAAQDYQSNLSKDQTKAQQIQNQINAYSLDSSPESQAKVLELKQQLADQQDKITKEQQDYSDKLVKQDLEDKKKAYDQDVQNQKDAVNSKYDAIINNDTLWTQKEADIINGHVQGIQTEMTNLIGNLQTYASNSMGQAKTNAQQLLSLVSQVQTASANLTNYGQTVNSPTTQSNSFMSGVINGTATSSDDMSWQDKLARAAQDDAYAISEIMRAKSVYNADMATGNTDGAQAAHKYADQLRTANPRVGSNPLYMDTGGFTGNGEGLAYLHSKELVLNKIDTSNILKVVDFTRDLIGRIKTPDFSSIIPKLNGSANTNLTINLGGINVTGDQKGGQTVLDTIVNGARRMGVNINKT